MNRRKNEQCADLSNKEKLIAGPLTSGNIKMIFAESADIVCRDILVNDKPDLCVTVFYVDDWPGHRSSTIILSAAVRKQLV